MAKAEGKKKSGTGRAKDDERAAAGRAKAGPRKRDLIAGLNEDLSWEFSAVITYRLFASLCSGPYRQEMELGSKGV